MPLSQTRKDHHGVTLSVVEGRVHSERHPDIEIRLEELKVPRKHAHDREWQSVDQHGAADGGWIRAKSTRPEAV
jgi:hypothetical protein